MPTKSFSAQNSVSNLSASDDGQSAADTADAGASNISRRSFIGRAAVISAAGVLAPSLPASVQAAVGRGHFDDDDSIPESLGQDFSRKYQRNVFDTLHSKDLRKKAFKARLKSAEAEYQIDIPPQPNNGDELRYPNKIAISTKGLQHDANGHVLPDSYESFLKALKTGKHEDFEKIKLGGTTKLAGIQGPLSASLEGIANSQLAIPEAAPLDSAELAAHHIEVYWQALLRDVPFNEYRNDTNNELVLAAVAELNSLKAFNGPKIDGKVTPETLFRSTASYVDYQADPSGKKGKYVVPDGSLDGPYISQFLLRPIPTWGTIASQAQTRPIQKAGETFGATYEEWLALRNGQSIGRNITLEAGRRHIINGRDLATLARGSGPTYLHVLQILTSAPNASNPLLGGVGAPLNPANPYKNSITQDSTASSFSTAFIQGLLALAGAYTNRVSYYQNWYVNRRLRPEDYGGLVHKILANGANYPIHPDILNSEAVARIYKQYGSYLLNSASNVGAPTHPGYPSGATISAATPITLLKAFFDENYVIPNPVEVDPNDPSKLRPYTGSEKLTVGGELNKLVNNVGFGRNFNNFHIRADISASHSLGEALAISLLRDQRYTYNEPFAGYTFTKFDGSKVTV
ncbi:twin-arginine translocation signal domain-containing protein [Methylomonas sp. TEB]|uniref:twin-arginine translocation signal domain-containing protein n=1 Tax=Methylomonas sp. TEB TaxID=3398229 RepID=UPI0039F5ECA9